jgi:hypothetical protein
VSRLVHISLLIYIPLLIAFMVLTADSRLLDALWFVSDKLMMCVMLLALRHTEARRNRKALLTGALVALAIYTIYLALDWQLLFRNHIIVVMILSATFIISLFYTLFNYDR